LPLIAAEIYDHRPDLVQAFPGAHIGENQDGFWRWICRHGVVEFQIDFLVTYFRRSLTSDSLVGFSEEIDGLQQKKWSELPFSWRGSQGGGRMAPFDRSRRSVGRPTGGRAGVGIFYGSVGAPVGVRAAQ
jgi:hypothetical protein